MTPIESLPAKWLGMAELPGSTEEESAAFRGAAHDLRVALAAQPIVAEATSAPTVSGDGELLGLADRMRGRSQDCTNAKDAIALQEYALELRTLAARRVGVTPEMVEQLASYLGQRGRPLQSYNREAQERIAREYLTAALQPDSGEAQDET